MTKAHAATQGTTSVRKHSLEVCGLFAGIGGLELGMARAGHHTDLVCEIDPGAIAVLRSRFPSVAQHDDIRTLRSIPASTKMIVAGFPCQDLSQAGQTAGIHGERSGLVARVFDLLRRRRVPWVLLENVPFMLQLARGHALGYIIEQFERLGYRWAYRIIDSRAFGVPQRRERVFFLASRDQDPNSVLFAEDAGESETNAPLPIRIAHGFYWTEGTSGLGWAVDSIPTLKGGSTIGIPSSPAIVLPDGGIVTPDIRDAERMQGFEPDWTAPAVDAVRASYRWKLVGNAVTVDVARWIGEKLASPGEYDGSNDKQLAVGERWPRAAWGAGGKRFAAPISAWPVRIHRPPLHEWLRYPPSPLSERATAGFLGRAERSSLRFQPWFLDAIRNHLRNVSLAMTA